MTYLQMKRITGALVIAIAVLASSEAHAFERLQPTWGDAGFLMMAVPLTLALEGIPPAPHDRPARQLCARGPRDVELLDGAAEIELRRSLDCRVRDAATWRRPNTAKRISDVLLFSWLATPVWAPIAGQSAWNRTATGGVGAGAMVGYEALAATYLVTGLLKHTVRRVRPDGVDGPYHDAFASFPSGHSSIAFSGATLLTVYAWEYEWGDPRRRWLVPATAYSVAAFTGYLRIGARRHWLTDVAVGALVGTGTTLLTHAVRL